MSYLVDGSNLLGRFRRDREATSNQRELIRQLASFARRRRTEILCYFDGVPSENVGLQLGSLRVIYSRERSADDLISEEIERRIKAGRTLHLVTSDRELSNRMSRRKVRCVSSEAFVPMLEEREGENEPVAGGEWEEYFSDPKNRIV